MGGRRCIILNCETCDLVFRQKNKYNLNFKVFLYYFSNKNERKYKIGLYLKIKLKLNKIGLYFKPAYLVVCLN